MGEKTLILSLVKDGRGEHKSNILVESLINGMNTIYLQKRWNKGGGI